MGALGALRLSSVPPIGHGRQHDTTLLDLHTTRLWRLPTPIVDDLGGAVWGNTDTGSRSMQLDIDADRIERKDDQLICGLLQDTAFDNACTSPCTPLTSRSTRRTASLIASGPEPVIVRSSSQRFGRHDLEQLRSSKANGGALLRVATSSVTVFIFSVSMFSGSTNLS